MINWHKHPNLKLNSALAILANLPARKTGTWKNFPLRPHQDPEAFLILAGISKSLNMSVPPLACAFRTAAINSDFIGATLGHGPKTLPLYQLTDIRGGNFHQWCSIYLWMEKAKFCRGTGAQREVRHAGQKGKKENMKKNSTNSHHTYDRLL